jgi:hypothetical protein
MSIGLESSYSLKEKMIRAAFLSHIAYDVFVDDEAKFPLRVRNYCCQYTTAIEERNQHIPKTSCKKIKKGNL